MSFCPICSQKLIPAWGSTSSGILLVGEYPGFQDKMYGKPWSGQAGDVLKAELARVGIQFSQCHSTNLWLHDPSEQPGEWEFHYGQLVVELLNAKAALFMGSELSNTLFKKSITQINGLSVLQTACIPVNVQVAVAALSPAYVLNPEATVGDFRFAIQRFANLYRSIE